MCVFVCVFVYVYVCLFAWVWKEVWSLRTKLSGQARGKKEEEFVERRNDGNDTQMNRK